MSTIITTDIIKQIRDKTGVSIMQCKKALEEAGGDTEKALIILSKQSSAAAEKKADRVASDGLVLVTQNENKAVLTVLYCETDFVSKNEEFVAMAQTLGEMALNEGTDIAKEKSTEMVNPLIQKLGENIKFEIVTSIESPILGSYVHNNKNACIVALSGGDADLARDIAMHATAMKPNFLKKEDITEENKKKVIEVFTEEVNQSDRPAEIKEKMLQGKIDTYFKEQTLLDQSFIKDPSKTISQLVKEKGAEVVRFERFSL